MEGSENGSEVCGNVRESQREEVEYYEKALEGRCHGDSANAMQADGSVSAQHTLHAEGLGRQDSLGVILFLVYFMVISSR